MRPYAAKVELQSSLAQHIRWVPRHLAKAMVAAGSAEIADFAGRIKAIRLVKTAALCAERVGDATEGRLAVRFVVREALDNGYTVWKHHPRSLWTLEPE